jgi:hypothetical protein
VNYWTYVITCSQNQSDGDYVVVVVDDDDDTLCVTYLQLQAIN